MFSLNIVGSVSTQQPTMPQKSNRRLLKALGLTCLGALALSTIAFLYQGGTGIQAAADSQNLASFEPTIPDGEVWLFPEGNFEGRRVVLRPGFRGDLGPTHDFDRTTSSFKLGRNVRAKFCLETMCHNPSW